MKKGLANSSLPKGHQRSQVIRTVPSLSANTGMFFPKLDVSRSAVSLPSITVQGQSTDEGQLIEVAMTGGVESSANAESSMTLNGDPHALQTPNYGFQSKESLSMHLNYQETIATLHRRLSKAHEELRKVSDHNSQLVMKLDAAAESQKFLRASMKIDLTKHQNSADILQNQLKVSKAETEKISAQLMEALSEKMQSAQKFNDDIKFSTQKHENTIRDMEGRIDQFIADVKKISEWYESELGQLKNSVARDTMSVAMGTQKLQFSSNHQLQDVSDAHMAAVQVKLNDFIRFSELKQQSYEKDLVGLSNILAEKFSVLKVAVSDALESRDLVKAELSEACRMYEKKINDMKVEFRGEESRMEERMLSKINQMNDIIEKYKDQANLMISDLETGQQWYNRKLGRLKRIVKEDADDHERASEVEKVAVLDALTIELKGFAGMEMENWVQASEQGQMHFRKELNAVAGLLEGKFVKLKADLVSERVAKLHAEAEVKMTCERYERKLATLKQTSENERALMVANAGAVAQDLHEKISLLKSQINLMLDDSKLCYEWFDSRLNDVKHAVNADNFPVAIPENYQNEAHSTLSVELKVAMEEAHSLEISAKRGYAKEFKNFSALLEDKFSNYKAAIAHGLAEKVQVEKQLQLTCAEYERRLAHASQDWTEEKEQLRRQNQETSDKFAQQEQRYRDQIALTVEDLKAMSDWNHSQLSTLQHHVDTGQILLDAEEDVIAGGMASGRTGTPSRKQSTRSSRDHAHRSGEVGASVRHALKAEMEATEKICHDGEEAFATQVQSLTNTIAHKLKELKAEVAAALDEKDNLASDLRRTTDAFEEKISELKEELEGEKLRMGDDVKAVTEDFEKRLHRENEKILAILGSIESSNLWHHKKLATLKDCIASETFFGTREAASKSVKMRPQDQVGERDEAIDPSTKKFAEAQAAFEEELFTLQSLLENKFNTYRDDVAKGVDDKEQMEKELQSTCDRYEDKLAVLRQELEGEKLKLSGDAAAATQEFQRQIAILKDNIATMLNSIDASATWHINQMQSLSQSVTSDFIEGDIATGDGFVEDGAEVGAVNDGNSEDPSNHRIAQAHKSFGDQMLLLRSQLRSKFSAHREEVTKGIDEKEQVEKELQSTCKTYEGKLRALVEELEMEKLKLGEGAQVVARQYQLQIASQNEKIAAMLASVDKAVTWYENQMSALEVKVDSEGLKSGMDPEIADLSAAAESGGVDDPAKEQLLCGRSGFQARVSAVAALVDSKFSRHAQELVAGEKERVRLVEEMDALTADFERKIAGLKSELETEKLKMGDDVQAISRENQKKIARLTADIAGMLELTPITLHWFEDKIAALQAHVMNEKIDELESTQTHAAEADEHRSRTSEESQQFSKYCSDAKHKFSEKIVALVDSLKIKLGERDARIAAMVAANEKAENEHDTTIQGLNDKIVKLLGEVESERALRLNTEADLTTSSTTAIYRLQGELKAEQEAKSKLQVELQDALSSREKEVARRDGDLKIAAAKIKEMETNLEQMQAAYNDKLSRVTLPTLDKLVQFPPNIVGMDTILSLPTSLETVEGEPEDTNFDMCSSANFLASLKQGELPQLDQCKALVNNARRAFKNGLFEVCRSHISQLRVGVDSMGGDQHNVLGILRQYLLLDEAMCALELAQFEGAQPILSAVVDACKALRSPSRQSDVDLCAMLATSGLARLYQTLWKVDDATSMFSLVISTISARKDVDERFSRVLARALGGMAAINHQVCDVSASSRYLDRASEANKKAHSKDVRADLLRVRADIAEWKGDWAGALKLHGQVLALRQSVHGALHPLVAGALTSMGGVYRKLCRWADARAVADRALHMCLEMLPATHPAVAEARLLKGLIELDCANFGDARSLLVSSNELRSAVLGSKHPQTLESAWAVAECLCEIGQYGQAQNQFDAVLLATQAVFKAKMHPAIIRIKSSSAKNVEKRGQLQQALGLFEEVVELCTSSFAAMDVTTHPEVEITRIHISRIHCALSRFDSAGALVNVALYALKERFGRSHVAVGDGIFVAGVVTMYCGKFVDARAALMDAKALYQKVMGAQHPRVAQALEALAEVHVLTGYLTTAEECNRAALRVRLQCVAEHHLDVTLVLLQRANILRDMIAVAAAKGHTPLGLSEVASTLYERVKMCVFSTVGDGGVHSALVLLQWGKFLRVTRKAVQAKAALEEALRSLSRSFGDRNVHSLDARLTLAMMVVDLKQAADCTDIQQSLKKDLLPEFEALLGPEHPISILINGMCGLCMSAVVFAKSTYEVTYPKAGPLMMKVAELLPPTGVAVLRIKYKVMVLSLDSFPDGMPGISEKGGVREKDFMVSINGIDLTDMGFDEAMAVFKGASWPKTIRFLRHDPQAPENQDGLSTARLQDILGKGFKGKSQAESDMDAQMTLEGMGTLKGALETLGAYEGGVFTSDHPWMLRLEGGLGKGLIEGSGTLKGDGRVPLWEGDGSKDLVDEQSDLL